MKSIIIILIASICLIAKMSLQEETIIVNPTEESLRQDVVFILGEDTDEENPYYDLAKKYYLQKTDVTLVDTCRSLMDVRNYLHHSHEGDQAYGDIQIIVHSNPWTGISVSVSEEEGRAGLEDLTNAIADGSFKPLSDRLIDSTTNINMQSCGLGNNVSFLEAFSYALGGFDGQKPNVTASKYFIQYKENSQGQLVQKELNSWYGFFKTGYRPGHIRLSRQFKKRYPEVKINWRSALERTMPLSNTDAYHYTMNVPVEWKVEFNGHSEMPELNDDKEILEFVKSQPDLMGITEKLEVPVDKFRWKIKKHIDVETPYIKLYGKTSIVCVLQEK